MQTKRSRTMLCASLVLATPFAAAKVQKTRVNRPVSAISTGILLPIIRAEDERRWDDSLALLMADKDARVRKRAALAAGRIGDERAVPVLVDLLRGHDDTDVRQMAAFALGEIESPMGAQVLIVLLENNQEPGEVRARAVEALGKIDAALPESAKEEKHACDTAILNALKFEADRRSMPDSSTISLGLTAALRAKPEGAGPVIKRFLDHSDPRVVADALNALARLHLKDGNDKARTLVLKRTDPLVRANAAKVLGATEDKQAFEALLDRALHDSDLRVRVSAIRALGNLKDARAAQPLFLRAESLLAAYRLREGSSPTQKNELLEIITTLGRTLQNSNDAPAIALLKQFRILDQLQSSETEIAFARISPETYVRTEPVEGTARQVDKIFPPSKSTWHASNSLAQGFAEFANLPDDKKQVRRTALADFALLISSPESHDPKIVPAIPSYLRAYAAFKKDVNDPDWLGSRTSNQDWLSQTLRKYLLFKDKAPPQPFCIVPRGDEKFGYNDVFVRATAAELVAEQPPSKENTEALITALSQALQHDTHDNDAALAILDALGKQKSKEANEAIKTALDSSDHLIRRRAVALLKANGAGDFSSRIGTVQTRNTEADYRRAIARIGKHVTATVMTSKGSFVIEFLPEDAPLTVDNFIQLARKGFFNGQTIPRVVPNFVIQAGDPRGDTNGGPGYSIRCEINEVPYERAAVGMALSGKDTGGSQWFVTHSPQPHLDGGYTVFGRVISGMEVVDRIARGDIIRRVIVNER